MLEHKMPVEQNRLNLGQKRIVPVDVRPARLHHPDLRIGEVMNRPQQKIFRRNEIRVEDGDELALGGLHPLRQRPRLEAFPVGAMQIADRKSLRCIVVDQPLPPLAVSSVESSSN